jgi:hypothetical protein
MEGLERILGKDSCLTKEPGQSLVAGEVMREHTNRGRRFDVRARVINEQSFACLNLGARFDRSADGHPIQCVSAATALGVAYGTDPHDARRSYVSLRSKLRKPGDDLELYRRIVLNAVVGNSDDHPWNTSLLQTGQGSWQLSPLYDVMPFLQRLPEPTFSMSITRTGTRQANMPNLIRAGREIAGLSEERARDEIRHTCDIVMNEWRGCFTDHARAMPDSAGVEIDRWAAAFEGFAECRKPL